MRHERSVSWRRIEALIEGLSKITGILGALSILAAAIITTEAVVVRKILGWSTTWQIELSVFLLMYACFVGAAYAQMGEHHLNIDLIIINLSPKIREIVLLIAAIVSCAMCLVVARYAWPMWWEAFIRNEHSESLWGPPLWIPYLFLPLGMTLLSLQYFVHIVRKLKEFYEGSYKISVIPSELKELPIVAPACKQEDELHE